MSFNLAALNLPAGYAVLTEEPLKISIDPAVVYPSILAEIEGLVPEKGDSALPVFDGELSQYWLEVAYQCAKLDAQRAFIFAGGNFGTEVFEIKILGRPEFALKRYPAPELDEDGEEEFRGILAAGPRGKEARRHFKRLRGFIPGA